MGTGAIALIVYSTANLFTEGGMQHEKISRTSITNGIGAIIGLCEICPFV